jgi:hypothetical protein
MFQLFALVSKTGVWTSMHFGWTVEDCVVLNRHRAPTLRCSTTRFGLGYVVRTDLVFSFARHAIARPPSFTQ